MHLHSQVFRESQSLLEMNLDGNDLRTGAWDLAMVVKSEEAPDSKTLYDLVILLCCFWKEWVHALDVLNKPCKLSQNGQIADICWINLCVEHASLQGRTVIHPAVSWVLQVWEACSQTKTRRILILGLTYS